MRFVRTLLLVAVLATIVAVPSAMALRFSDASYITPEGIVGTPYSHTFQGVGGCPPYSFSVINGSLPAGLTLSSSGTVSGTPTAPGTSTFWVDLADKPTSGSCTQTHAQREFSITIIPKLTITTESAPAGTVGTAYGLQLTTSIGGSLAWSLSVGPLPPGITLDPVTGLLAGTPTTAGDYPFEVKVTDPKRSDTKKLTIAVRDPLAVPAAKYSPPGADAEVGLRFGTTFKPTGGFGPYTWTLAAGSLPPGLVFAPTGLLAGVPTAAGTYPFQLTVTDAEGRTASLSEEITVATRLTLVTRALRPTKVGRAYTTTLRSRGGIGPVTWKKVGPLPRGLRIDATTGQLSWTPTKAGSYRIRVRVTDAKRVQSATTLVLKVNK